MNYQTFIKLAFLIFIFTILFSCGDENANDSTSGQDMPADQPEAKSEAVIPPVAKKIDHFMSKHGHKRNDPYYWLRDDTRTNKDVLDYLNAENSYTKASMAHTEALQQKLYEEMTER
ncbi:MAG: oligopeptidase B, partial [Gammaproteobacteria bacterium]|nr:oligopeptidase B [Gammaproteobacteria bacterium]